VSTGKVSDVNFKNEKRNEKEGCDGI